MLEGPRGVRYSALIDGAAYAWLLRDNLRRRPCPRRLPFLRKAIRVFLTEAIVCVVAEWEAELVVLRDVRDATSRIREVLCQIPTRHRLREV